MHPRSTDSKGVSYDMHRPTHLAVSVTVATVIFALAHVAPQLMPYMLVLGLSTCWLGIFHRNIWAPLILHVTLNAIASSVLLSAL